MAAVATMNVLKTEVATETLGVKLLTIMVAVATLSVHVLTIAVAVATFSINVLTVSQTNFQALRFLCSARRPVLVNISLKFHEDALKGFNVIERTDFVTETAPYKVQRGITQSIYIEGLWFLRSARLPMLVNI